MTQTAEAEALIERLNALAADAESNGDHGVEEACDKAASTIRALLERNKELERERDQLLDKLHCMCGSPIDHSAWEGHTPVSVYDYSLDQERSRAEAAEAELAEAIKVLEPFAAVAEHDIGDNATDDDIFWPISNARYTISGRLRVGHLRAARKFLKENGYGE